MAGAAALKLVFVADHGRMDGLSQQERRFLAGCDTGHLCQNAHLTCRAEGLATVGRGWVDRSALAWALVLRDEQEVTLEQPLGRPAQ